MMRSTTFLMQVASPPKKDLINYELVSSLGESQVQFTTAFQKSNTFCQRGLKCHLNFDSVKQPGSQETCACINIEKA